MKFTLIAFWMLMFSCFANAIEKADYGTYALQLENGELSGAAIKIIDRNGETVVMQRIGAASSWEPIHCGNSCFFKSLDGSSSRLMFPEWLNNEIDPTCHAGFNLFFCTYKLKRNADYKGYALIEKAEGAPKISRLLRVVPD